MRRLGRLVLALSVVVALVGGAAPAVADVSDESQFVDLINQSRAAAGMGALTPFWDLTDDARVHTAEMIGAGQVFHSSSAQLGSYATGWARLGENVGMGPNPALLHQAFMNSSSHRANILGDYDLIGVGADRSGDGTMFVTVLFMKSAAATPTPTPTTTTTTTTTTPPTTTTTPPPTATTTSTPQTTTTPTPTTTPTSTTTAPPQPTTTTSTEAPTPSTTGAASSSPATFEVDGLARPSVGERPATKAAGVTTVRGVAAFRPIFSALTAAGSDPIIVFSSNGFPLVIE